MTGAPLLFLLVTGLLFGTGFVILAWSRARLWASARRSNDASLRKLLDQSARCRYALTDARDALATVINDSALFGASRDQALSAYDAIREALKKERTST